MSFDLSTAKPVEAAPSGGFDLKSAKPVNQQDDYESLYQKYVSDYNDTKNQVPIPGTPPVDQGPLLSKEEWKARNDTRFRNNLLSIPLAVGEQALNLAGGVAGAIPSVLGAGGKAINDLSQGRDTSFEKDYSQLFGEASSVGTKLADMTGINTGAREAISQGVGNFMNRIGIPMAGLNLPHINKNAELRRAMPELFQQPEVPQVNPVLDKLKSFDLSTAKPVDEAAVETPKSTAMSPSQLKEWADLQEKYAAYKRGELPEQKQAAAQAAIDARQAALEQGVARQTALEQDAAARQGNLDRNAAERARQEAAPTGYAEWLENQRQQANTRLPGDNTPMDLGPAILRNAKNYPDVNDYPNLLQDAPYKYEGGIDYTAPRDQAALPVEVADILRTGDKNPDPFARVSYRQNANRMAAPLEEHITDLNRSEAQPNSVSRWEGEGGKFGQRGAIDVSTFKRKSLFEDKSIETLLKNIGIHPNPIDSYPWSVRSREIAQREIYNKYLSVKDIRDANRIYQNHRGVKFDKQMAAREHINKLLDERSNGKWLDELDKRKKELPTEFDYANADPNIQEMQRHMREEFAQENRSQFKVIKGGKFGQRGMVDPDILKEGIERLFHGGRKFGTWDPKTVGSGEGMGVMGPGLYAGNKKELAHQYLKYGGSDARLSDMAVDTTRILETAKKFSPEMRDAYAKATAALDALGLRATQRGVKSAMAQAPRHLHEAARKALIDAGIDGFKENLGAWGHEYVIFNPDVIKQISDATGPVEKYTGKFGQRGAINVKGIQEAYRKWRDGTGDDMSLFNAFKGTFHPEELRQLKQAIDGEVPNTRVVFMDPDLFRNMASERTANEMSYAPKYHIPIKEALKSDNGLAQVPHLMLKMDDRGILQVVGHDGRHRMDMMKANGIDKVPVRLISMNFDWSDVNSGMMRPEDLSFADNLNRSVPPAIRPSSGKFNKQSGKVDLQSIKEEAEKVGKWFSSIGTKAIDNLTPKERIALNAVGDDSYIPKGDAPEKIIAAAKAQPDGPSLFTQMQSGLGGAALKTDSAMMFGVNRHLQWAHKVAEKWVRENVKPIEQRLSLLNPKELQTVNGIMRMEMFDRKQFTNQQLLDAGANQKVIDAYKLLREKQQDVFVRTNEARAKLGLEPITQQAAYYNSQWNGNWHMPVYEFAKDKFGNYKLDENGNKVRVIRGYVKTETRAEANKAMQWVKANMPDVDASTLKVEYKPQNIGKGLPRDVTSTFNTMLKIFEDTPMAQQMKEMMDLYRTEQAFNERGFSKHFEEKANVRFFLGDRPWLSEKENAQAGMKAQVNYLKEAYRWAPLQEAMANIKEVLSDPDLVKNQPNNMAVTKAYVANAMGISQSVFRGIENDIAQFTGRSPSKFGSWTRALKSMTYIQQLSASGGYFLMTPMQSFVLGPSRHRILSKEGFKYNPIKTIANTLSDMGAILTIHELQNIGGKDFRNQLSPIGQQALRYMEDNGIITMKLFDEYSDIGANKIINIGEKSLGASISFPEKMARTMTFMSFVHHLNDGGMSPGLDMFRKAEELTNATLTEFHKNARPLIVDRMGMTGELLYTYKSPLFNYYNSLFEFGQHWKRTGDPIPLALAIIMPGILGGVMAMPAVQEIDGGIQLLKEWIAKTYPSLYPKIRDIGIKEFALKHLPDIATYGTMSVVTGAQMESRFSNQIVDPNNPLANVAPVAQEVKEQLALLHAAEHPNWTTIHEGLYQNLPPAAKGFQETTADTFKGPKRDDGTQTYYNPNQLENRQAYVNRTPKDEAYRKLGMTSLPEARQRDVRYASNEESKRLETARDTSMTKMFDAVIMNRPEDIKKYAISYFMNDGNDQDFQKELQSKIMTSGLTPEERQAVYAKTISDVQNLLRQLQMNRKVQ